MRGLTWHEGRHRRRSHRPLRPAIPRDRALESGPSGTSLSLIAFRYPFPLCEVREFILAMVFKAYRSGHDDFVRYAFLSSLFFAYADFYIILFNFSPRQ